MSKQTAVQIIGYLENNWLYDISKEWVNKNGCMILNLNLSTYGHSNNETIIEELKNSIFWHFHWHQSTRGGHYKFEINFNLYGYLMVSEFVKLNNTTKQKVYHNSELYDWIHISKNKKMIKIK